jgi:pimeloyl-ACP methyl ester carboxylesterase
VAVPESAASPDADRPHSRRRLAAIVVVPALVLFVFTVARFSGPHLRAMAVLMRFSSPQAPGFSAHFAHHPYSEQVITATTAAGPLRYRLYTPQDMRFPSGMVLLHGVHHLGIEEPRLVSFSRALASAGIEVMTPELHDLADYHVVPHSIDEIGLSSGILSRQLANTKVGIMGLSFAGGMALLAASRPEYAGNMAFVLAVGAHDDLARVSRFFAVNAIEKPDGSTVPFQAHEYGVLVLAYSHLEDFFSAADIPVARETLREWLWEKSDAALLSAHQMTPEGQHEFDELVHHRGDLQQQLVGEITKHHEEMEAVSPHEHLGKLTVPVFLLHGSGDSVIPASETLWLEQDVPQKRLQAALISPALVHVSMEQNVSAWQKWELVHFLARVLAMSDGNSRYRR